MPKGEGMAERNEDGLRWGDHVAKYLAPAIAIGTATLFAAGYAERRTVSMAFGLDVGLFPEPFAETASRGFLPISLALIAILLIAQIAIPVGLGLAYVTNRWIAATPRKIAPASPPKFKELKTYVTLVYGCLFAFTIALLLAFISGTCMGFQKADAIKKDVESGCSECFEYDTAQGTIVGSMVVACGERVAIFTPRGLQIYSAEAIRGARKQ